MRKLVLLFFIIPVFSTGQEVSIDFEDQDLTDWYQSSAGHWGVTTENPVGGEYSLRHVFDNDQAGSDWIAFFHQPLEVINSVTSWQFSLRYDFNPSANNNWAIMLGTDCLPDETQQLEKALIFGVNYEGNDDILKLWKIDSGLTSVVLNTGFNWEENINKKQPIGFRIGISEKNEIAIEIDTSGTRFVLLAGGELYYMDKINVFGILYNYTSSNDRGLAIDDIIISGDFLLDDEPPHVKEVLIRDPQTLEIRFSETVRLTAFSEWCVTGIGCNTPEMLTTNLYQLSLPVAMTPGNKYNLIIRDIQDVYGNQLYGDINQVFYYPASYDLIITEIMADPGPPVLLPEVEYIELFNRSNETISIENWHLTINDQSTLLPAREILADDYLVLCEDCNEDMFEENVNVLRLMSMGTLNNNGAEIILQDISGKLIHTVTYDNAMYSEADKKNGGWSLEMIDTENPCELRENWTTSTYYKGGTPGWQNSVYSSLNMHSKAEIWRIAVTQTGTLMVYFSEPLDSLNSSDYNYYTVNHSVGKPVEIKMLWPVACQIEMIFETRFTAGKTYELSLTRDVLDCSGNPVVSTGNNKFSVPQSGDSTDVVINEIMYEPKDGCIEYVELYNNSEKTIDLQDWRVQTGDNTTRVLTNEYFPLLPGSYAIIASDIKGIENTERFREAYKIIEMPELPLLSNEGNVIKLMNKEEKIIDMARYDPAWHHELYSDTKGKSLERISPNDSGMDRKNWQSASSASDYQTPGSINSQSIQVEVSNQIRVTPETITPNGDGLDDELNICYRLDGTDYMTRVLVYDLNGRMRRSIANGGIPGTEGCYYFDGKEENGDLLPTGYYVLYYEAYDQYGRQYQNKTGFVIAVE